MRTEYHKLVRDGIPEIIRREGGTCAVETLSEEEYRRALLEKLVEEAREAKATSGQGLVRELADLHEVIDAVIEAFDVERAAVLAEQQRRRTERGGFTRRFRLLWTE